MSPLENAVAAGDDAAACLDHALVAWQALRIEPLAALIECLSARAGEPGKLPGRNVGQQHAAWLAHEAGHRLTDRPTLLAHLCVGRAELALERLERVKRWSP